MEIVSIDEVVLSGVEIVSGGRTLRGDIDVVPQGNGLTVKQIALNADDMNVTITGQLTDMTGPTGQLTVKAGALDVSQLLAFVSDFSKGAGLSAARVPYPVARSCFTDIQTVCDEHCDHDGCRLRNGRFARARQAVGPGEGNVGGHAARAHCLWRVRRMLHAGTLTLALGDVPDFRVKAALSGIDMAAAMKAAGNPGTITGRLSGTIDVAGHGLDAASVQKSARGTLQVDVADGIVKNLGLIQAVVVATSMRSGSLSQKTGSRDEAFTHLGGTLAIANGAASTSNLRFESTDMTVSAAGSLRLDGSAVDLKGQAQLSEALSQQAGRDLLRYSQEGGRVTLPATIGGSAGEPAGAHRRRRGGEARGEQSRQRRGAEADRQRTRQAARRLTMM